MRFGRCIRVAGKISYRPAAALYCTYGRGGSSPRIYFGKRPAHNTLLCYHRGVHIVVYALCTVSA